MVEDIKQVTLRCSLAFVDSYPHPVPLLYCCADNFEERLGTLIYLCLFRQSKRRQIQDEGRGARLLWCL